MATIGKDQAFGRTLFGGGGVIMGNLARLVRRHDDGK
jgi:hypothetical protein